MSLAAGADLDATRTAHDGLYERMRQWCTAGGLLDFLGVGGAVLGAVRAAADYDRLIAVTATYDSGNPFRVNHNAPRADPGEKSRWVRLIAGPATCAGPAMICTCHASAIFPTRDQLSPIALVARGGVSDTPLSHQNVKITQRETGLTDSNMGVVGPSTSWQSPSQLPQCRMGLEELGVSPSPPPGISTDPSLMTLVNERFFNWSSTW